ncbi:restriction endonuclease [uncultured Paludibaculum sp.]|uniref:restriction endonuclease n=1 Tax=uncultured Paludibaculum sp. TaxID=1765020 RepID=UPI002AAC1055|nr:restriction endonuclease [uncultured Paludibaculum sp.]
MPREYTLDDIHAMSWQEFESVAVNAVRRLYRNYGIDINKTPYSHDGGRDGEAQHVLAIGLGPDLAITIKVFLEIKKRDATNVGKSDLGSHVVDAFTQKVTKIIFVTNREFAEPLSKWLDDFCGPLGIQYSLIAGRRLLEMLNGIGDLSIASPSTERPPPAGSLPFASRASKITGRLTFSLHPNDSTGWSGPCIARADRPVFAIVDLDVGDAVSPFHGLIRLRANRPGTAALRSMVRNRPVLFSPGERQRWVFAVWLNAPGQWDSTCCDILLEPSAVGLEVRFTNVIHAPEEGLAAASSGSQGQAERAISSSLKVWHQGGGVAMRVLIAPAGLGKSFIVGRLRREWQGYGLHEVMLDGETISNDAQLIERTFSTLFPLPMGPFDQSFQPALEGWLEHLDLAADVCKRLSAELCRSGGLHSGHCDPRLRAELLASLIAEAGGEGGGLVFVFEDLHKVSPSVLSILSEGVCYLRSRGRGNVFVLATSRPSSEAGAQDLTASWLRRLQVLSALAEDGIDTLHPPSEGDAHEILRATIPTLATTHVRRIIEQVGTIPFNLREAVLYLRQLGIVSALEPNGRPVLLDPSRLGLLLEHEGLHRATQRRIEVFFRDRPDWLRRFVEAGACWGRQFSYTRVAGALGVSVQTETPHQVSDCARWSLLALSPDGREHLEFDHDLVRASVLELIPDLRRRELAELLLEHSQDDDDNARRAGLAYQAGRADEAFDLSRSAARQQRAAGRPADALRANHIAILTLDSNWGRFHARNSAWVDIAIQAAPACRRKVADWQERDKEALAILRDNLDCLGTLSAGSSNLSDALLSEARLVSQRLGDQAASASLLATEGRLLFERNELLRAAARHKEAETAFAEIGTDQSKDRAENLVRLAICQRQLGHIGESLGTLRRALKYRVKSDWTLLNKVRSNTGAAYLLSDWTTVRHHWERQLRSAKVHKLPSREAHALASLSFINLFDGRPSEGRRQAEEALEIARRHALDNTRVRCDLNLSVYFLLTGNAEAALSHLNEAEALATQHQIDRRLWRVYANLATTYELLGDLEQARARDVQTLLSLGARTWPVEHLLKRGRHLLPLLNVALRAPAAPQLYGSVFESCLPPDVGGLLGKLATKLTAGQRPSELGEVLLKYLLEVGGKRRFLLTE